MLLSAAKESAHTILPHQPEWLTLFWLWWDSFLQSVKLVTEGNFLVAIFPYLQETFVLPLPGLSTNEVCPWQAPCRCFCAPEALSLISTDMMLKRYPSSSPPAQAQPPTTNPALETAARGEGHILHFPSVFSATGSLGEGPHEPYRLQCPIHRTLKILSHPSWH